MIGVARKGGDVRGEVLRKQLQCLDVTDQERRDFIVEECTWEAANSMLDVDPSSVAIHALSEISLEVSGTVLVGVDLYVNEIS